MRFDIEENGDIVFVKHKTVNNVTKERREICTDDVVGAIFNALSDNDDYKRDGVSQSYISQKNNNDRLQVYDFSRYVLIDRTVLKGLKDSAVENEETEQYKNQLNLAQQENERARKIISEYEKKLTDNGISTSLQSDKPNEAMKPFEDDDKDNPLYMTDDEVKEVNKIVEENKKKDQYIWNEESSDK